MSAPTRPSDATLKKLFARSGNRCAYDRCTVEIVQSGTIVGEVCHIKAASPSGPRYDPQQSPRQRHGYDNLILLCRNHHVVVDDDPETYTVERLVRMKGDHESRTSVSPPAAQSDQGAGRGSIVAWVRGLHRDRVEEIAAARGPVPVLDGGLLTMHVVPFGAFGDGQSPSFNEISRNPDRFPPIVDSRPRDWRIRFDGLLTGSNADGLSEPQRAYVHVSRSGAVEAVASSLARGRQHNFLQLPQIQAMIIKYAYVYARSLNAFGIQPPFAALASLAEVKGMRLLQGFIGNAMPEDLAFGALSQDRYHFVEAIFETMPADYVEGAKRLRPLLEHIANAAGLPTSPYFDDDGNYTLQL